MTAPWRLNCSPVGVDVLPSWSVVPVLVLMFASGASARPESRIVAVVVLEDVNGFETDRSWSIVTGVPSNV